MRTKPPSSILMPTMPQLWSNCRNQKHSNCPRDFGQLTSSTWCPVSCISLSACLTSIASHPSQTHHRRPHQTRSNDKHTKQIPDIYPSSHLMLIAMTGPDRTHATTTMQGKMDIGDQNPTPRRRKPSPVARHSPTPKCNKEPQRG